MDTLSIRLPERISRLLDLEARQAKRPRSDLARQAIVDYLERLERERALAGMVAAARAIAADPEAIRESLELADDLAALDDALLDAAQASEPNAANANKWWK